MEQEIEKKIKDLKEFIKQKTDQGTANYLGEEIRKICGMVETEALSQHDVSGSLVSPDVIQKEAERFQKATTNKMAIERTAFAQGALWVRSLFLPNDR